MSGAHLDALGLGRNKPHEITLNDSHPVAANQRTQRYEFRDIGVILHAQKSLNQIAVAKVSECAP